MEIAVILSKDYSSLSKRTKVATRRESVSIAGFEEGGIFRWGFVVGFLMELMGCMFRTLVIYEGSQCTCVQADHGCLRALNALGNK